MNKATWDKLNDFAYQITLIVKQAEHDNWRLLQIAQEVEQTLNKEIGGKS